MNYKSVTNGLVIVKLFIYNGLTLVKKWGNGPVRLKLYSNIMESIWY